MKLRRPTISSNKCRIVFSIIPISKNTRWLIGRQYNSIFVNHPFWCFLQKKRLFWWSDMFVVDEPFYPKDRDTYDTFIEKTVAQLKDILTL